MGSHQMLQGTRWLCHLTTMVCLSNDCMTGGVKASFCHTGEFMGGGAKLKTDGVQLQSWSKGQGNFKATSMSCTFLPWQEDSL